MYLQFFIYLAFDAFCKKAWFYMKDWCFGMSLTYLGFQ
jgi:hypothetical protein